MYAFMKASQPVLQSLAVHPSAGTGSVSLSTQISHAD